MTEDGIEKTGLRENSNLLQRVGYWLQEKGIGDRSLQQRAEKIVPQTKILDYLKPGGIYLDVGAGLGHIVEKILKERGQENIKFISLDPIRFPADPVEKRVKHDYPGQALFIKAEAEHLPITPNSIDGISLFFVLHHIPQGEHTAIIEEVRKSLKTGGYLFLVEDTPEGEEEHQRIANWDKRLNLETSNTGHFYRSYQEWVDFLEKNGFKIEDHSSFEDRSSFKNEGVIKHSSLILRKI